MTAKQRSQVVELLRCTFDRCQTHTDRNYGVYAAAHDLGHRTWDEATARNPAAVFLAARAARVAVELEQPWVLSYEETCLEAAARLEEGTWP